MPILEKVVNGINKDSVHPKFRLWLTTNPTKNFPVSILQQSTKLTFEPPKGIRANLLGTFMKMDEETFNGNLSGFNSKLWKKMLFALCCFHAVVQERRKYGSLGWNHPYEFNESDLMISIRQLESFLALPGSIQFKGLRYVVAECNYGGKIVDKWDRRCINHILSEFFAPEIKKPKYSFSESGIYYAPEDSTLTMCLDYIRQLPLNDEPEVFGMHKNANMTHANYEITNFFETISSLQFMSRISSVESQDRHLLHRAEDIYSKIPDPWSEEEVLAKHPISYENSMNAVLFREIVAYNKLIVTIKRSLVEIRQAIRGFEVMTSELEQIGNEILAGVVPTAWRAASYLSQKPLFMWVSDLVARIHYFQEWIEHGEPRSYWISGFFLPRNLILAFLQKFARKYSVPLDEVSYTPEVVDNDATDSGKEEDSFIINGLYLEGARWDKDKKILTESNPKELFFVMPSIRLRIHTGIFKQPPHYTCPVYMTLQRRGEMSTLGNSSNFVMTIDLPTNQAEKHWAKRGAALFCQINS